MKTKCYSFIAALISSFLMIGVSCHPDEDKDNEVLTPSIFGTWVEQQENDKLYLILSSNGRGHWELSNGREDGVFSFTYTKDKLKLTYTHEDNPDIVEVGEKEEESFEVVELTETRLVIRNDKYGRRTFKKETDVSLNPNDPNYPNDPDNPDNPNSPTSGNYVLASIKETERFPNGTTLNKLIFSNPIYNVVSDYNVITSYKNFTGDIKYNYLSGNSMTCDPHWNSFYSCSLTRGLISEIVINQLEKETFEYDSKYRLISVTTQEGADTYSETFSYDGYNVIGSKYSKNNVFVSETKIEYTTIPAKTIPLQFFDDPMLHGMVFFHEPYWVFMEKGAFGNSIPMYLIHRITYGDYEIIYDYTLNKNGYVVKMETKRYQAGGSYFSTYSIEWQEVGVPSYTNWLFSDIGSPYYRYLYE